METHETFRTFTLIFIRFNFISVSGKCLRDQGDDQIELERGMTSKRLRCLCERDDRMWEKRHAYVMKRIYTN